MVNGYVTLDLASKNIYKEALGAIKAGKPVMVVDAPDVYFADTIKTATIDGDNVVQITKGSKTITINDANAVSSEGDIKPKIKIYEHRILCKGSGSGENDAFSCTLYNQDPTPITLAIFATMCTGIENAIPCIVFDSLQQGKGIAVYSTSNEHNMYVITGVSDSNQYTTELLYGISNNGEITDKVVELS